VGPVSTRPSGGGGGGAWPRCALELGAPNTSDARLGDGSQGTTAPGHAWGWQGSGEREAGKWDSPEGGA
jgi:hypothetical protein